MLLTAGDFIANLALWRDPPFVVFFVYFLITILGGITILLLLKPVWCVRRMIETPELFTFAALIVGAAVVGNADIWRYLVFLLPVIAILFAAYARDFHPGPVILTAALAAHTRDAAAVHRDGHDALLPGLVSGLRLSHGRCDAGVLVDVVGANRGDVWRGRRSWSHAMDDAQGTAFDATRGTDPVKH